MEPQDFYYYAGRDLGVRYMSTAGADEIDKTASAGEEINEDYADQIDDFLGSVDYVDTLQKVARADGAAEAYAMVLEMLEAGEDLDKVAEALEDALEASDEVTPLPMPMDEQEKVACQDAMIIGVAEAMAQLAGVDADDPEVLEQAAALVASELN